MSLARAQRNHVRARVEGVRWAAHRLDGHAHAADVVGRVDLQPARVRAQGYAHAGGGVAQRHGPGALGKARESVVQLGDADDGGGAEVQPEGRHVVGGHRDHGRVGLVDDRRGVGQLQIVRTCIVDGQVGVESDAVGGGALADVRRGQLDAQARLRIQAVAGGCKKRPRIGIARRDEGAQEGRGGVGLDDVPLLEDDEAVQGRPECGLIDGEVVGRVFPRVGAACDAVRPRHENLAEIARGTLVDTVGHHELVPAVAQATQSGTDGDDPRLVVPGLQSDFAP